MTNPWRRPTGRAGGGCVRPLVRLSVSVQVEEEDGKRESAAPAAAAVALVSYEYFLADLDGEVRADAWSWRYAWRWLISAVAAPARTLPVVLGAVGILHEAVRHRLEGDFNRRGTSVFSGQIGDRLPPRFTP